MATRIRPNISEGNKYWISKERYYELKHFCLQYNDWLKMYNALNDTRISTSIASLQGFRGIPGSPTEKIAIAKSHYKERLDMVRNAAFEADPEISNYILKAVTDDISCSALICKYDMPCGKDKFYAAYRRFFYHLSVCRE